MEYLGDHTDTGPLEDGLYRFKCITDHYQLIKWETGEQTWETLRNIIAVYAKKHDLLNTPGRKLSKRHSKDNNKWKGATDLEFEQIKEYQVFKDLEGQRLFMTRNTSPIHQRDTRRLEYTLYLMSNTVENSRLDF